MGKVYSDEMFRGHITQALLTCSPDVFRYLWISYTDPLRCPLDRYRRLRCEPWGGEHLSDPEVAGLILGYDRRW